MRYDVIVAGAGPGGSTAARECASRGLSVLMLDKSDFPRDKPCGGGVSIRAAGELPFDVTPVVERVIYPGLCHGAAVAGLCAGLAREDYVPDPAKPA